MTRKALQHWGCESHVSDCCNKGANGGLIQSAHYHERVASEGATTTNWEQILNVVGARGMHWEEEPYRSEGRCIVNCEQTKTNRPQSACHLHHVSIVPLHSTSTVLLVVSVCPRLLKSQGTLGGGSISFKRWPEDELGFTYSMTLLRMFLVVLTDRAPET